MAMASQQPTPSSSSRLQPPHFSHHTNEENIDWANCKCSTMVNQENCKCPVIEPVLNSNVDNKNRLAFNTKSIKIMKF